VLAPASQFLTLKGDGGVELYAGKAPIPRLTVLSAFAGELKIVSKTANRDWQHAFELPGDYVCVLTRLGADQTCAGREPLQSFTKRLKLADPKPGFGLSCL
jgi:hypothetical protein